MTNELRKTLGRNMRFSQMNENIDNQIRQLQTRNSYDVNAQMQINALEQQKALNEQQMQQPMSAAEYAEYDDNGQYIGTGMPTQVQPHPDNDFKQMALDGMNHFAQGASLGWSDEAYGAAHGVYDMGRTWYNGNPDNEEYGDIYNRSYVKHRDAVRQELEDGYQRNPVISGLAEIGGALVSPIKPFSGMTRAVSNGVIGGIGMTDTNSPAEYAVNIGLNTTGSVVGEKTGNLSFGLTNLAKPARVFVKASSNGITNQINNWRKK